MSSSYRVTLPIYFSTDAICLSSTDKWYDFDKLSKLLHKGNLHTALYVQWTKECVLGSSQQYSTYPNFCTRLSPFVQESINNSRSTKPKCILPQLYRVLFCRLCCYLILLFTFDVIRKKLFTNINPRILFLRLDEYKYETSWLISPLAPEAHIGFHPRFVWFYLFLKACNAVCARKSL